MFKAAVRGGDCYQPASGSCVLEWPFNVYRLSHEHRMTLTQGIPISTLNYLPEETGGNSRWRDLRV